MKKSGKWILISICAVVLIAGVLFLPDQVRNARYWWYFRSQGITFNEGYSPNGGSYYWFVAQIGPKRTGREIPLGGAPTSQHPRLRIIDLEGDGIPEIHISGEDPADPGRNFFRFIPAAKNFEVIPIDQVPNAWKRRLIER